MNSNLQFLVMGFGVMIAALSGWGVVAPARLVEMVTTAWKQDWAIWMAVGVRVLLGWSLLQVADASRCPLALTVLGWLAFAGAVAVLVMGRARVGSLLDWFAGKHDWLIRAWCGLGVAFGAFLLWAVG